MEKAIHYKWPAVRNFHAAICNAVDSERLSWDDLAEIRLKSVTHFSHADLRVQNSMEAKSVSRNSKYTGQPKEVRNGYCEPWNDFNNCTCSPSDPKYKDTHLCKICDNDHPKLSCPLRRFPIKTGKSLLDYPDSSKVIKLMLLITFVLFVFQILWVLVFQLNHV